MLVSQLHSELGFAVVQGEYEDRALSGGFTSDLLSDVMGKAGQDSVFITIQAHKNSVAVAALAGIAAIVICSSRPIPEDMVQAAKDEGIAVFTTGENQFAVSGRVWDALRGSGA